MEVLWCKPMQMKFLIKFSSIDNYDDLNKMMARSEFCFKFVSNSNLRCEKVNVRRGFLFIELPNWLK